MRSAVMTCAASRSPVDAALDCGLRVRFLEVPDSARGAALVRVHGGSHDAPVAYPGLAHFLEHLLFLGSAGYPVEDGLMACVQRCGGQLNASTRERHTDYFFQVPQQRLEDGLVRLADMLAAPLLDIEAQRREREVLHAEYLARSQDAETLCDAALGVLVTGHPLAGFHAGKRDTLPVDEAEFQQALAEYHRSFYHKGTMELLLAGPFPRREFERYARLFAARLGGGGAGERRVAPLRVGRRRALRLQLERPQAFLHLAFYLHGLAADAPLALDLLGTRIASRARDGLHERLLREGLCLDLRLRCPYWHAGQALVVIEAALGKRGQADPARIEALLSSWLAFNAGQGLAVQSWRDHGHIRRNALRNMTPLERLRHWVEPHAWSEQCTYETLQRAWRGLMTSMANRRPLHLLTDCRSAPRLAGEGFELRLCEEADVAPCRERWQWREPLPNPWLRMPAPIAEVSMPAALQRVELAQRDGLGSLHIRWRFVAGGPACVHWQCLDAVLRARAWAAKEAGVQWWLEDFGSAWCLTLRGVADSMVGVAKEVAAALHEPPEPEGLYSPTDERMLLGRLLERLPAVLDEGAPHSGLGFPALWQAARWDALAVGVPSALGSALLALPGVPASERFSPGTVAESGVRWFDARLPASETALLLFCPLPSRLPAVEAAWRLLARLLEGAFFRRMRSELQLGYGVFAGFRQFGERGGIVFGVQSPVADAERILGHIDAFLQTFDASLERMVRAGLQEQAQAVARQLDNPYSSVSERADLLWQACLAGCDLDHPARVAQALPALEPGALRDSLRQLRAGGWRVLVNAR
ncbi:pyrroloquinoline quinone biosynthesis protein PqqF [Stutzerimonas kirkiae]|nr:pyrroloquinoline quinone biosynthesis protein PqqF [Stutzerimonas kirkiae]